MPIVVALIAALTPTLAIVAHAFFATRERRRMQREARGAVLIQEHAAARARRTADETKALVNGARDELERELAQRDATIAELQRMLHALIASTGAPESSDFPRFGDGRDTSY